MLFTTIFANDYAPASKPDTPAYGNEYKEESPKYNGQTDDNSYKKPSYEDENQEVSYKAYSSPTTAPAYKPAAPYQKDYTSSHYTSSAKEYSPETPSKTTPYTPPTPQASESQVDGYVAYSSASAFSSAIFIGIISMQ